MTRDIREVVREEPLMRRRLLATLGEDALSVSELADRAGLPASEVMVWMMGMRKYGDVAEESAPDGDHYRYKAVRHP